MALVGTASQATVRLGSAADLSSGVIISADGYVLTVAHGLAPSETQVTVQFFDGGTAKAKIVYQNPTSDVALLKLVDAGKQTFGVLPLATEKLLYGTVVLAFGHPARDKTTTQAIARLGTVVSTHTNSIRSTCALTAGDSGGPLINANGRLVGINQRIGANRSTNLHLSIDACCAALKGTKNLRQLHLVEPINTTDAVPLPVLTPSHWQRHAVEILDDQQEVVAWGTAMNAHTVVTKLSRLKPNTAWQVRTADRVTQPCTLIGQHRANDLAVLRLTTAIDVASVSIGAATGQPGSLVYGTAGGEPGIVARVAHAEPDARPRLGCTLFVAADGLVVEQISANSAATDAGLKPRDELLKLADQKTTDLAAVGQIMEPLQPGDWVSFHIRRSGTELVSFGQLRHPPAELLNRSEFLDGRSGELSARRSSFAVTLQHDLPLTAAQMGGPLLTADGRVIGINIARRAREAVLAVPIANVLATCPEINE